MFENDFSKFILQKKKKFSEKSFLDNQCKKNNGKYVILRINAQKLYIEKYM